MQPVASGSQSRGRQQASRPAMPALPQLVPLLRMAWWLLAAAWGGQYAGVVILPERLRVWAWWVILAGLCVLLTELAIAGLALIFARTHSRSQRLYLRIRAPNPMRGGRVSMPGPSAAEFWYALHGFVATNKRHSPAQQLAMVLGACPDQPLEFGVAVAAPDASACADVSQALRRFVMAFSPDSFLDVRPDPLDTVLSGACQAGVVLTAELRVRRGDGMPIRIAGANDMDVLAPLAAQLQPALGTLRYAELSVLPEAADRQHALAAWWRVAATRRLERYRGAVAARDATDRLERKLSGPLFHVTVRVVLVADDAAAGHARLRAIAASLGQYAAQDGGFVQGLVVATIRTQRIEPGRVWARAAHVAPRLPPIMLPCALWRGPLLLGAEELAGLWHLPSPSLAGRVAWLPNRHLPAPAHAFLSHVERPDASPRLVFGHAIRADGTLAPVGPSLRDLRQIMHITAGMGGGKSRLLANLAQQLFSTGFFLIDGKGDDAGNLAHTVARLVPPADERRLAWLDIADYEWPIGLNPMAAFDPAQPGALDQLVAALEATFARLDPETWHQAPGMQQFLGHAARLVRLTEPLATLAHVQHVLVNDAYREALLERLPAHEATLFWRKVFPRMPESQRGSLLALLRRFEKLLGSELMRAMIAQSHSTIDLARMFDERLIVLCPIPHVAYGTLAGTAATLLMMLFLRAAFMRPGTAETRADYPLLIDELQVLIDQGATQDVMLALTQLRSLGVPAIYAHQTLAQLGELRDVLLVNAENRVLIRTQEPDASVYARHYAAAGVLGADISEQNPHCHQYARFLVNGVPVGPCSLAPLTWPVVPHRRVVPANRPPRDAWRRLVPAGGNAQQRYDGLVARLAHAPYSLQSARELAGQPDDTWALFVARWQAIAQVQRDAILQHQGYIPDQVERQRWLSRLAYARPRLLAEVERLRVQGETKAIGSAIGSMSRRKRNGAE